MQFVYIGDIQCIDALVYSVSSAFKLSFVLCDKISPYQMIFTVLKT